MTNLNSNNLAIIDTGTNTIIDTVNSELNPLGVTVTPDGAKVYILNSSSSTVSVLDTAANTITAVIPVGLYPFSAKPSS
ncbi:YncE family protein [Bacillus velezensis]